MTILKGSLDCFTKDIFHGPRGSNFFRLKCVLEMKFVKTRIFEPLLNFIRRFLTLYKCLKLEYGAAETSEVNVQPETLNTSLICKSNGRDFDPLF